MILFAVLSMPFSFRIVEQAPVDSGNAMTIAVSPPDFGLLNALTAEMRTQTGSVLFCGIKVIHPLATEIMIRVSVSADTNVATCIKNALLEMRKQVIGIINAFDTLKAIA